MIRLEDLYQDETPPSFFDEAFDEYDGADVSAFSELPNARASVNPYSEAEFATAYGFGAFEPDTLNLAFDNFYSNYNSRVPNKQSTPWSARALNMSPLDFEDLVIYTTSTISVPPAVTNTASRTVSGQDIFPFENISPSLPRTIFPSLLNLPTTSETEQEQQSADGERQDNRDPEDSSDRSCEDPSLEIARWKGDGKPRLHSYPSPPTSDDDSARDIQHKQRRNGQIAGYNRKTKAKTLVGTYPPIRLGPGLFKCSDPRCDDQPPWTTQNGYKYHLKSSCLQNPDSVRSKVFRETGIDMKKSKTYQFQCSWCGQFFKSEGGHKRHLYENESTKNGKCMNNLKCRAQLQNCSNDIKFEI